MNTNITPLRPEVEGDGHPLFTGRDAPPDDRLAAFADLLAAVDRRDVGSMKASTRRLRAFGFSVVYTGAQATGGR